MCLAHPSRKGGCSGGLRVQASAVSGQTPGLDRQVLELTDDLTRFFQPYAVERRAGHWRVRDRGESILDSSESNDRRLIACDISEQVDSR